MPYAESMSSAEARNSHSVTVGFSIAKSDQPRPDRLVQVFSGGNRSAFLRMAMDRMEVADRAQRLRCIQSYGVKRSSEIGISPDDISDRVKRVLARRAEA